MLPKYGFGGLPALMIILSALIGVTAGDGQCAQIKSAPRGVAQKSAPARHLSKAGKRTRQHGHRLGLVPPPPAYMPSILPELAVRHSGVTTVADARFEEKKPENPYRKYINTPNGEAPMPVQSRKGVSTWNPRS